MNNTIAENESSEKKESSTKEDFIFLCDFIAKYYKIGLFRMFSHTYNDIEFRKDVLNKLLDSIKNHYSNILSVEVAYLSLFYRLEVTSGAPIINTPKNISNTKVNFDLLFDENNQDKVIEILLEDDYFNKIFIINKMRNILFRGKRVNHPNKGTWAIGSLVTGYKHPMIVNIGGNRLYKKKSCIISETLGQYIELCDRNGIKIFEGDVLKNIYNSKLLYKVVWYNCQFLAHTDDGDLHDIFNLFNYEAYEVIGNIYDNPKLWRIKD